MNILEKLIKGQINFTDGVTGEEITDIEALANMIKSLIELQLFYEKITKGNSLRAS